jgi:RNA polymerase sigma-54 factor
MQGQRQTLVQQQRLNLSPQMVQSIKLMAMPFADLRERILEEAEKNPALEIVSDPVESPEWQPAISGPDPFAEPVNSGGDEESDDHQDFIEGVLHRDESLQEHLITQLGELKLAEPVRALAELVIQNLDRDGFHVVPPEELPGGADSAVLAAALDAVRRLDPVGCATRGFQESLVVQARLLVRPGRKDPALDRAIDILENHFELLEKGRPDALVKALQKKPDAGFTLSLEEAEDIFEIIRSLDPYPGRAYDKTPETFVAPDVIVRKEEDSFSVVINDEEIPVLGLSPFFMELDEAPAGKDKDSPERAARDFARESVKEAQWFIHTLSRRNMTILKVARAIIFFQRDFFMYGPSRLAPLRLKDVAEETGMHEATVSRAANGKYLQCEWGLFELKYFFSNQVGSSKPSAGSDGAAAYTAGRFSKQGVKEVIREIVAESKESLSDQKITDQLALRGIKIARRTVAKYRSELDIGSSFDR